jgi:hypothetical protein
VVLISALTLAGDSLLTVMRSIQDAVAQAIGGHAPPIT